MPDPTLRSKLIRLAHAHPEFRDDLLPLLKDAAFSPSTLGRKINERLKDGFEVLLVFERGSKTLTQNERAGRDAKRPDLIGWGWGAKEHTGPWFGMTMPAGMQVRGSFPFSDDLEAAIRR